MRLMCQTFLVCFNNRMNADYAGDVILEDIGWYSGKWLQRYTAKRKLSTFFLLYSILITRPCRLEHEKWLYISYVVVLANIFYTEIVSSGLRGGLHNRNIDLFFSFIKNTQYNGITFANQIFWRLPLIHGSWNYLDHKSTLITQLTYTTPHVFTERKALHICVNLYSPVMSWILV